MFFYIFLVFNDFHNLNTISNEEFQILLFRFKLINLFILNNLIEIIKLIILIFHRLIKFLQLIIIPTKLIIKKVLKLTL